MRGGTTECGLVANSKEASLCSLADVWAIFSRFWRAPITKAWRAVFSGGVKPAARFWNAIVSDDIELLATAAAGTEAVVKRELAALGYEARTATPGRLEFRGDASAICRANLWLRTAERVLIQVGSFSAKDFGALFDGTAALAW